MSSKFVKIIISILIGILLLGSLIFLLNIFLMQNSGKKMPLPKPEEVRQFAIFKNEDIADRKNDIIIENTIKEHLDFISKNAKFTKKQSVNDAPNADYFIGLDFPSEKQTMRVYLYKENGKAYAEIPYSGIWEVRSEVYDQFQEVIEIYSSK